MSRAYSYFYWYIRGLGDCKICIGHYLGDVAWHIGSYSCLCDGHIHVSGAFGNMAQSRRQVRPSFAFGLEINLKWLSF